MEWYLKVLREYSNFTGRARRTEYWMFGLINFIISIVLAVLQAATDFSLISSIIYYGYSLIVLIPGLAVSVRRMHDIGKSGWMLLIILIPIIGPIWLIVLAATEGNSGDNQYGPDPKQEAIVA